MNIGQYGGAIAAYTNTKLTATNCVLKRNTVTKGGGALFCYNYAVRPRYLFPHVFGNAQFVVFPS